MNRPNHALDSDRVRREPWPFDWTPPAPGTGRSGGWAHPLSTLTDRQRLERYAAQAALYTERAVGRTYRPGRTVPDPDLVIVDEISGLPMRTLEELVAERSGTRLHRLMEALGAERRERPR